MASDSTILLKETTLFLNRGVTPSYIEEGGIAVLNQKCIRDEVVSFAPARRTDVGRKPVPKDKYLQSYDILVNSTGVGTLGRVAQIKQISEPTTVDSHVTIVRPNPDVVAPQYLGYVLRSRQDEIESLAEGSTGQTELSRIKLGELRFPLPPLPEQKAIARILGTLDDKIELNRRMNATLEAMARALFQSWFVDFDPVHAKAADRPPSGMDAPTAALFPSSFQDSELGDIPVGWSVKPLSELCSYLSRGIGPAYLEAGGVLVLNQKCIRDHRVNPDLGRRHNDEKKSIKGRLVEQFDVLVNSTGVGTLGRVAQVLRLSEPTIVDSHVTIVRAAEGIDRHFLGVNLTGRESEIEGLGEGSTGQTELSRVRLGTLPVLTPPTEVQSAFGQFARPIFDRIAANDHQSRTLATLRDTLLPKLLSGEAIAQF